jgi:tRNA(Ile)-lysidine synthase
VKFIKTIQNFASQYNLWQKGSKIIIGVSGGPDSVCLLEVLSLLAKKSQFELQIAHVNYGLRGKDSDQDEQFVRKLGEKFDVPVNALKVKKGSSKGNLENSLRNIRYAYFEKLRLEKKFDLIAVAHNGDDQAETVLMRIIRGSGLNGLSAMKPSNGKIIRPLLETPRSEIEAYLKEKHLEFRIDKTNLEPSFARNKIRLQLLPFLEKNYNPAIKKTLGRWSTNVGDDYAFIASKSERFTKRICKNKYAAFDAQAFFSQHVAIQRQVLRNVYTQLLGGTENLENQHIEEILKVAGSSKNKIKKARIAGLNVLKKGDKVEIFC